jgi:hypothetical protein
MEIRTGFAVPLHRLPFLAVVLAGATLIAMALAFAPPQ